MLYLTKLEGILLKDKAYKKIFRRAIFFQWNLLPFIFYHVWITVLKILHIIDEESYMLKYWKYLEYISDLDAFLEMISLKKSSFMMNKTKENYEILKNINIAYYCLYPEIIKSVLFDAEVLAKFISDMDSLEVCEYSTVNVKNKKINKKAIKKYLLQKNKLIEMNWKYYILNSIFVLFSFVFLSAVLCVIILSMTPLVADLNLITTLITDPLVFVLNMWPIFVLLVLLYCLFNSISTSFILTSVMMVIMVAINHYKIMFRDDPFVFSDILYVNEAMQMTNNYKIEVYPLLMIVIVFILLVFVLLIKLTKYKKMLASQRFVLFVICLTIFLFSFKPLHSSDIYYKTIYNPIFGNQWAYTTAYTQRGFVYSFLHTVESAFPKKPEGYSKEKSKSVLREYKSKNLTKEKKVNVIAIMLEAYNDFSKYDFIEFENDPYKYFHEIQNDSYHGKLMTNIFAAGTIETERAFLTGYSDLGQFRHSTISFVDYFNYQGYLSEAMHPCHGWFYNRKNANLNLGFDRFYAQENTFREILNKNPNLPKYHGLMQDTAFFEYIMDRVHTVSKDKPYFNFSVTYQNHGPYNSYPETDTRYLKWEEDYNESDYNIMNNYLYHISQTDEALKLLYDEVKNSNEPIVVVVFGDHNPWLGEGNSVYEMLGINIDLSNKDGILNYYETPYFMFANDSAELTLGVDFLGEGPTISPNFLMTLLMDKMGWKGTDYNQYQNDYMKEVEAFNSVLYGKDDEYYFISENASIIDELKQVEYYLQYDKRK